MAWRRNKFGARKTEIDGIVFDSLGEGARYQELKLRLAAGEIREFFVKPEYSFEINGKKVCKYSPDYEYEERQPDGTWKLVSEDFKGFRTPVYRLKAKLFSALLGRPILETGRG